MNIITREEYLNALELIDQYHQQTNISNFDRNIPLDEIKAGHKVIFDKVMTKHLTTGKEYLVQQVFPEKSWYTGKFTIIDDTGKIKRLKKDMQGYIMRIVY